MDEQYITVRHLEEGIVEFTVLSSSRNAVDAFFRALSQAMQAYPKEQTFRYLVDIGDGEMPPVAYFVGKNRAWVAANPDIAPTRAAVLLTINNPFRAFALSLAVTIMRGAKSPLKLEIFAPEERDKALAWLLANL